MRARQVPEVAARANCPELHTMIAAIPSPVWVIGTYDAHGKPNIMAASWCGIASSSPHCISVSLKTGSFSAENVINSQAFSVCIPSVGNCTQIDTIGSLSGRTVDKFALTGLTSQRFKNVHAPLVNEFNINIGCKLIKSIELGSHTMFIGEVAEQLVSDTVMNGNSIDMALVAPMISAASDRRYFTASAAISEIKKYIIKNTENA